MGDSILFFSAFTHFEEGSSLPEEDLPLTNSEDLGNSNDSENGNKNDNGEEITEEVRELKLSSHSGHVIRQVENKRKGIGFQLWPAAYFLCDYISNLKETKTEETIFQKPIEQMTFLELGAGTGLCGLYFAALGAQVILTDMVWISNSPSFF